MNIMARHDDRGVLFTVFFIRIWWWSRANAGERIKETGETAIRTYDFFGRLKWIPFQVNFTIFVNCTVCLDPNEVAVFLFHV